MNFKEDNSKKNNTQNQKKVILKNTLDSLYENWFLDYASYVILERAIPNATDGLKPVQRRVLHAMKEMDDGRFHKVANIIGFTMQFHPHGDAAIGDALVKLGQKDFFIETQGNWGDAKTGDAAAAPRYIEARLSKLALDVAFNNEITNWQKSYDGRRNEPIELPIKFPILLLQGAEGIAVGLSTKIMPHNFNELIKASISIIKNKEFKIFPDFPTGGLADFTNYQQGKRGGKIRLRCSIEIKNNNMLIIHDIPFSTTTNSLIDSIIKANDSGKIKIKKVEDNTAEKVEILIHLSSEVSPNITIDALYAFTQCEVSISPNCCVVLNGKPQFISINELLKISTQSTLVLLEKELQLLKTNLLDKLHSIMLEKIFIENRIYRDIEKCDTWELIINTIEKKLTPFSTMLEKDITVDDINRLTEIKIKRISNYSLNKADELIKKIKIDRDEVINNLNHLNDYAVRYYESLIKKYGHHYNRLTKISKFDNIEAKRVVVANKKLYVNRETGFIGYGLKQDEFVMNCSDIDDIIVFFKNGKYLVTQNDLKKFVGKNIIHISVWNKKDSHMVYNVIYSDGDSSILFVKRFSVNSLIRDREYDVTMGSEGSEIQYLTANPNSESEIVTINLYHYVKARKKIFDFDFSTLSIKSRLAKGNILTKYKVRKISHKTLGESSLGGRKVWLDETIGKINHDGKGIYLGSFSTNELILIVYKKGNYKLIPLDLSIHIKFNEIIYINKFSVSNHCTLVYYNGENDNYYLKRFLIETKSINQDFFLFKQHEKSKAIVFSVKNNLTLHYKHKTKDNKDDNSKIIVDDFSELQNWKSMGKKIPRYNYMKNFELITKNDNKLLVKEDDTKETLNLFNE